MRGRGPRHTRAVRLAIVQSLTLDVHNLRQELYDLAMRRTLLQTRSLYTRVDSPISILRVVGRYFHVFANGYRDDGRQPEQHAFVQSIADETLSLGVTGLGVETLLAQWHRYTDLSHVRDNVLVSSEILTRSTTNTTTEGEGTVVKCALHCCGRMTRHGVDTVFPYAAHEPALLLRAFRIPMLSHLYFNDAGLLVRHDVEADFLSALRDAFGGDAVSRRRTVGAREHGRGGDSVQEREIFDRLQQYNGRLGKRSCNGDAALASLPTH